jgi:hypothetical protein
MLLCVPQTLRCIHSFLPVSKMHLVWTVIGFISDMFWQSDRFWSNNPGTDMVLKRYIWPDMFCLVSEDWSSTGSYNSGSFWRIFKNFKKDTAQDIILLLEQHYFLSVQKKFVAEKVIICFSGQDKRSRKCRHNKAENLQRKPINYFSRLKVRDWLLLSPLFFVGRERTESGPAGTKTPEHGAVRNQEGQQGPK